MSQSYSDYFYGAVNVATAQFNTNAKKQLERSQSVEQTNKHHFQDYFNNEL